MDRAVVPVDGSVEDFDGDEYPALTGVDCDGERCFLMEGGKLTKEDIDTMAATLFKETSGPGYCHLTRADTKRIAAAMAVSIGLEVED